MANTFFPAVQYQQLYQPQNQLDQMQKAAAIKSSQQQTQQSAQAFPIEQEERQNQAQLGSQQVQIGQVQAQDAKAASDAMHEWDGKNMEELPGLLLKHGGSAQAVFGLRDKVIAQKQNLLKLSSDERADQEGANNQLLGKLNVLDDVPDAKLSQEIAGISSDPAHQQTLQQLSQIAASDPSTARDHLDLIKKSLMGAKEQFAQANTAQETAAKQLTAQTEAKREQFEENQGGTGAENRELNYFIKNPPSGYKGTPTDFMRYKATVTPLAQINVANAAGGGLNDTAILQAAQRYLTTGQLPPAARGIAGLTQNRMIMNRAAELDPDGSITSNSANYAANKKSLENVTGTLDTLSAFENTGLKNLKQFNDLAAKIPDTGVPWLNTPIRNLDANLVGSENMAAVNAARNVALREIARVTNDPKLSGALTDSSRAEVSSLIPANATFGQIKAVSNVLAQDMANVHTGLAQQKQDIQSRLKGGGQSQQNSGQQNALMYARDPQGKLHSAPAGTKLPSGWTQDKGPQ